MAKRLATSESEEGAGLVERLRDRREDFSTAAVADFARRTPELPLDPELLELARRLAVASFDYGLECMRLGTGWSEGEPAEAAEVARIAARQGVRLAVVLRAYRGAHSVIWDLFAEEIAGLGLDDAAQVALLKLTLNAQFDYFGHLAGLVAEAYSNELESRTRAASSPQPESVPPRGSQDSAAVDRRCDT